MKINNTLLTQLRSLSVRKGKGQPHPFIFPLREWVVCLSVSVFFALGLFSYAGLDFKTQLRSDETPEYSPSSIPSYRAEEAELLIRNYEGRARTFNTLRENKVMRKESVTEEVHAE